MMDMPLMPGDPTGACATGPRLFITDGSERTLTILSDPDDHVGHLLGLAPKYRLIRFLYPVVGWASAKRLLMLTMSRN